MFNKNTPLSAQELEVLRSESALSALTAAATARMLSADLPHIQQLFADEPTHPAAAILTEVAHSGGRVGTIYLVGFVAALTAAVTATAFSPEMPASLFIGWVVLGLAGGHIAKNNPGLFGLKR